MLILVLLFLAVGIACGAACEYHRELTLDRMSDPAQYVYGLPRVWNVNHAFYAGPGGPNQCIRPLDSFFDVEMAEDRCFARQSIARKVSATYTDYCVSEWHAMNGG